MSVVVHEFAHGYTAYLLGDNTARDSGRLTLNPIKHLDLFGSILLPLFLILSHAGFVIGWAKPVPYNPHNVRGGNRGTILVSIAGILSNILLAIIFGLLIRYATLFGIPPFLNFENMHPFYRICIAIVTTNLVLALFNLIPIPPLDGSKILFALLPPRLRHIENFLERWGIIVLIFFIVFLWKFFEPFIYTVFSFITGIH